MATNFQELDELEFTEWMFNSLVKSLCKTKPSPDASPDDKRRLSDNIRMLEAGVDVLRRLIGELDDVEDRIEALGCVDLLMDSAVRIALAMPNSSAKAAEASGKNRIRKRLIRTLQKLYPSDPVVHDGLSRKELRAEVARAAGLPIESIDPRTLDRARENAWVKCP